MSLILVSYRSLLLSVLHIWTRSLSQGNQVTKINPTKEFYPLLIVMTGTLVDPNGVSAHHTILMRALEDSAHNVNCLLRSNA